MRLLAFLAAIVGLAGPASALSLEQYFFELSDRERGAYVTGFLDLFVRDSARDADYRACVERLGAGRLHQAVTDLVKADPRFLAYDAMSWLLYEASRLCNQKPPANLPPPAEAAAGTADAPPAVAALPAAPDEAATAAAPQPATEPADSRLPDRSVLLLALATAAGAAVGAAAAYLAARRGRRPTRRA